MPDRAYRRPRRYTGIFHQFQSALMILHAQVQEDLPVITNQTSDRLHEFSVVQALDLFIRLHFLSLKKDRGENAQIFARPRLSEEMVYLVSQLDKTLQ